MSVLVSDNSVLIDLERGSFLDPVFRLPFEFAVPDLLYEREIRDHGGPALIDMGLRAEELDGAAVALALEFRRARRSLSLPDSFALSLSKANSWTLLSGDGSLRALALEEAVECHGVLWLLNRLHEHQVLDQGGLTGGAPTNRRASSLPPTPGGSPCPASHLYRTVTPAARDRQRDSPHRNRFDHSTLPRAPSMRCANASSPSPDRELMLPTRPPHGWSTMPLPSASQTGSTS